MNIFMENMIIIVILAAMLFVGIRASVKHFRGEGGCCGGGKTPVQVPEKQLIQVIGKKIVTVDGMTCEHCKSWVERAINEIDGAAGKVTLKKREVVVSMEREVGDDEIRTAIKNAGYRVLKIKREQE